MRLWFVTALVACSGKGGTDDVGVPSDSPETYSGETSETGTPAGTTADTGPSLAPPLELCINEFMPGNVRAWDDGSKSWPDWIELHNPGSKPINLMGWSLTDDRDDPRKHPIVTKLVVAPGEFLVLVADGQPDLGPTHLSFALGQDGEEVALFRDDGSGEIISYGAVADDLAVSRVTDCGPIDEWEHTFGGTPGASNEK